MTQDSRAGGRGPAWQRDAYAGKSLAYCQPSWSVPPGTLKSTAQSETYGERQLSTVAPSPASRPGPELTQVHCRDGGFVPALVHSCSPEASLHMYRSVGRPLRGRQAWWGHVKEQRTASTSW